MTRSAVESTQTLQLAAIAYNYLLKAVAEQEAGLVDRLVGAHRGGTLTDIEARNGIAAIAALRSLRDDARRKASKLEIQEEPIL